MAIIPANEPAQTTATKPENRANHAKAKSLSILCASASLQGRRDENQDAVLVNTMQVQGGKAGPMDNVTIALCWADPMDRENSTYGPNQTVSNQQED